jgi:hypothetical protein
VSVIVIVVANQDSTSSRLLPGSSYSCCIRNLHALVHKCATLYTSRQHMRSCNDVNGSCANRRSRLTTAVALETKTRVRGGAIDPLSGVARSKLYCVFSAQLWGESVFGKEVGASPTPSASSNKLKDEQYRMVNA